MSNKYIVPIGVLIAAVLIIAGGYMVLNPYPHGSSGTGNNINDNESYIEETQNFIPDIKIQQGELKRNADLQLKIGNKYRYEYNFAVPLNLTMAVGGSSETDKENVSNLNIKMSRSIDIVVDRKEMYNKSDVFVLKSTGVMKYENLDELIASETKGKEMTQEEMQPKMQSINMLKEGINTSGETWLNNDGKTVKTITNVFGMEITMEGEKAERSSMMGGFDANMIIQPWMFALNENFEWTKNTTMNMSGFKSTSSERYKVVTVEEIDTKIGKKKCYKVEEESISSTSTEYKRVNSNNKISGKTILWIDYNTRILVKAESWMENLKIGSIELVDEK